MKSLTLGKDVPGQHEIYDQEQRAHGCGNHHVACERSKHSEHGHRILVHQKEDGKENKESASYTQCLLSPSEQGHAMVHKCVNEARKV